MKPKCILALFITAVLLILPEASGISAANAAGSVVVSVDTLEITMAELEKMQYDVPLYIRLLYNSGVSAGKFTVYTEGRPVSWYLSGDPDAGNVSFISDMAWTAEKESTGGIAFAYSSGAISNSIGIIAKLVVHLDDTAAPGDEVHITLNMPYGADPAEYADSDNVWSDTSGNPQNICIPVDGVIRILEDPKETESPAQPDVVKIAIDQTELLPEELAAADYVVPVYVRLQQNPGVTAAQFNVYVDSRCTFTSSAGEDVEDTGMVVFGTGFIEENPDIGALCYAGASGSLVSDTGPIIRLDVRVPENARPGDVFPIVYNKAPENITLQEEPPVWNDRTQNPSIYYESTAVDGYIRIGSDIKGDADGSCTLELADVVLLQRYLLGLEPLPRPDLADIVEDGIINVLDLCLLKRWVYSAGSLS